MAEEFDNESEKLNLSLQEARKTIANLSRVVKGITKQIQEETSSAVKNIRKFSTIPKNIEAIGETRPIAGSVPTQSKPRIRQQAAVGKSTVVPVDNNQANNIVKKVGNVGGPLSRIRAQKDDQGNIISGTGYSASKSTAATVFIALRGINLPQVIRRWDMYLYGIGDTLGEISEILKNEKTGGLSSGDLMEEKEKGATPGKVPNSLERFFKLIGLAAAALGIFAAIKLGPLAGAVGKLVSSFGNLQKASASLNNIFNFFKNIKIPNQFIGNAIGQFTKNVAGKISGVAKTVGESPLGKTIGGVAKTVVNNIGGVGKTIVGNIGGAAKTVAGNISGVAKTIAGSSIQSTLNVAGKIGGVAKTVAGNIGGAAKVFDKSPLGKTMGEWGKTGAKILGNKALQSTFGLAGKALGFTQAAYGLGEAGVGVWDLMHGKTRRGIGGLVSGAGDVLASGKLIPGVGWAGMGIGMGLHEVGSFIKDPEEYKKTWGNRFKTAKNFLKERGGGMAAGALAGAAFGGPVGAVIGAGLGALIPPDVTKKFTNQISGVKDSISKSLIDTGKWIGDGFKNWIGSILEGLKKLPIIGQMFGAKPENTPEPKPMQGTAPKIDSQINNQSSTTDLAKQTANQSTANLTRQVASVSSNMPRPQPTSSNAPQATMTVNIDNLHPSNPNDMNKLTKVLDKHHQQISALLKKNPSPYGAVTGPADFFNTQPLFG